MATSPKVKTRPISRDKLAFFGSHELIKHMENMSTDVSQVLPDAVTASSADVAVAQATADAAQLAANAAQSTANAAQSDATALKAVPYVTIGTSPTTSNERALAVDTTLKATVGGPGGSVTLGIADSEAWVAPTLVNSWVNFGGGFNPAGYYKDPLGIVHLRGMVMSGTAAVIFTLPAGYRPPNRELHATISNGAIGRIDVSTNGDVSMVTGTNVWISLDGITFRP